MILLSSRRCPRRHAPDIATGASMSLTRAMPRFDYAPSSCCRYAYTIYDDASALRARALLPLITHGAATRRHEATMPASAMIAQPAKTRGTSSATNERYASMSAMRRCLMLLRYHAERNARYDMARVARRCADEVSAAAKRAMLQESCAPFYAKSSAQLLPSVIELRSAIICAH